MKKKQTMYILMPLLTAALAIGLDCLVDTGVDFSFRMSASALYLFRLLVAIVPLASMVSVYTLQKEKPLHQIISLNLSALLVTVDYYANLGNAGSDNLLWLLPMIILVYLSRYRAILRKTTETK